MSTSSEKCSPAQAEDKLKLRSQSVIPRSRKITFECLLKIKVTNKDLARCKESLQFVVYGVFMLFTLLLVLSMMMVLFMLFVCCHGSPHRWWRAFPASRREVRPCSHWRAPTTARARFHIIVKSSLFNSSPLQVQGLLVECWSPAATARPSPREIELFLQRKNLGFRPPAPS